MLLRSSGKFREADPQILWKGSILTSIQLNNKHAIEVLTTDMDNGHSKQNDS